VIRLGLRLTLNGGREAAVRFVATAATVALGVGLLLIALAGMNALNAQNARTAWLNSGTGRPSRSPYPIKTLRQPSARSTRKAPGKPPSCNR